VIDFFRTGLQKFAGAAKGMIPGTLLFEPLMPHGKCPKAGRNGPQKPWGVLADGLSL